MLDKDAVNEYRDFELCGNVTYEKKSICQIIQDSMILNVVGTLQNIVA